ncbi:helix-turn-helix transcriptional regulator [Myroides odoratimimus]|uniref:HTH cro/C1-type domain-containing protein n=1 Tax=Myroides odoratimimus TaxID=76832 RepID=A0AAI8C316_9FLAO|nr:helix-turn-helix transcriptional regulator [Myroides odoratimimus]ALU25238.1 hypothetical protein AS202_03290 [Myroides odoratimimus]
METIGLRLKKYFEFKGAKRKEFCEEVGLPYNSLTQILNSSRNMSSEILDKVFTYFPELNARWLVTGNGPMEYTAASYHLDPVLEQPKQKIDDPEDFVKNITKEDLDTLLDDFIEKDNVREKFKSMLKESLGMIEKENKEK